MTIREQIATLPEPYRAMAEKYEKDQRWLFQRSQIDWDKEADFINSFAWFQSDEGGAFWYKVSQHLEHNSYPLPPIPPQI